MELLRPSSVEELDGGVFLHGGTEVVPLLRDGLLEAERLVDVRGVVPRGVQDGTDRCRHDARRARGRARDPGRAPRGVPARGLAAAAQHGLARRQPAPGDALLVLAARLPMPPPRRRPLPRPRGRAPRARDLRERLLRVGASVRRRRGARRARRAAAHRAGASSRSRSCTGSPTRATGADDARGRRADPRDRAPGGRKRASTSRRWTASAGRSRRSASRSHGMWRLDADRARRRRTDPVASGVDTSTLRRRCRGPSGSAARAGARPPRARFRRLIRPVSWGHRRNLVPAVSAPDVAVSLRTRLVAATSRVSKGRVQQGH